MAQRNAGEEETWISVHARKKKGLAIKLRRQKGHKFIKLA